MKKNYVTKKWELDQMRQALDCIHTEVSRAGVTRDKMLGAMNRIADALEKIATKISFMHE